MHLFLKFKERFSTGQPRHILFKGLINCHLRRASIAENFPEIREILAVLSSDSRALLDRFQSSRWLLFFAVLLFNELLEGEEVFIAKLSVLGPREMELLHFKGNWRRNFNIGKCVMVIKRTQKKFLRNFKKDFQSLFDGVFELFCRGEPSECDFGIVPVIQGLQTRFGFRI